MSDPKLPEYYNNLDRAFSKAWEMIAEAAENRHSPMHTPVVGSVDDNRTPQQRIMVLRAADKHKRHIRFNTDLRAPKVVEIQANPSVSALFYDFEAKMQIRLSGKGHIVSEGAEVDEIWVASDSFARRCYLAEDGPSSPADHPTSGLSASIEGRRPDEAELVPARENFAVLQFEVHKVDWFYLANEGHRRAKWDWDEAANLWQGQWLVP